MAKRQINLESIKRDRISDSDQKLFDIFSQVLDPRDGIPPAEAAKLINEMLPVEEPAKAGSADIASAEQFLWNLWALLLRIVQAIPHEHPGQEQVSELVEELSRLPPKTLEVWEAEARVWTDLPLLGPCLRESWIPPTSDGEAPNEESARKWISLNSFAARVLNKDLADWTDFAVWQLRSSLEEPVRAGAVADCDVAAAAEWILRGGEGLFARLEEGDLADDEARRTKPGSLYRGKAGLCRARWEFWKGRFGDVGDEVDEETGRRALLAAQRMKEIEERAGKRSSD